MPLAVVLPIVVYAYAVQAVVVSRTESRERELAMHDVDSLVHRLKRAERSVAVTCRDYAHWDETYEQVLCQDNTWLNANFGEGLGSSAYDFDIGLLQSGSGKIVWSKGIDSRLLSGIKRYGLLKKCMGGLADSGLAVLDQQAYMIACIGVRRADSTGKPRGMVLVGRRIDNGYLAEIAPDTRSKLALCQYNGQAATMRNLGTLNRLPPVLSKIMIERFQLRQPIVEKSTDGKNSYGMLPVRAIDGRKLGVIAIVTSRAGVLAILRTIRHFSFFLMALCAVIGIAGVSYSKNRTLALRANRDQLTGLYNHGYLQDYLKHQMQIAGRYSRSLAVIMIDIDHFKYVNDIHGHSAGDQVLKAIAELTVNVVRTTDIVARYGGEEFVVVMPESDILHAISGAERLRKAVSEMVVRTRCRDKCGDHTDLSLTISAGVAAFPSDGCSSSELLLAADTALADAKRTRNTVRAFEDVLKTCKADPKRLPVLDGFLRDSSLSAVKPLVTAIDTRDPGSVRHSEKTAEYAVAIGREIGLVTQELALTCKAALLHDVGMIGVPDHLITKVGSLNEEEMTIVKRHSKLGHEIIMQSPQLAQTAEMVLHHHERYDGQGYPDGLIGEDIPLISRIVAVADSLDAMTSPRSYKEALSIEEALKEIRSESGKQFDPMLVQAAECVMLRLIQQRDSGQIAA
ncbi:MAG: diguanylate cyclase [Armatimonadota bacterium]